MQLLNSKILSNDKNTRYSNKKAQDTQYLVLFVCCSFFVLQRWWRCGDLPYSDCYRRSIACSRRGSRCKATARLLPCEIPADNKKQAVSTACFFGGDAGFVANIVCVITEQRRTQCFLNRIVASDNAHSFACVLLFPTGTQYPAGSPEYRISDRLRSTICCKQQCYAFVRQIAQSLAMSAALDFRKCKRLLLSSLAVSPGTGVHTATPCCDFSKSQ